MLAPTLVLDDEDDGGFVVGGLAGFQRERGEGFLSERKCVYGCVFESQGRMVHVDILASMRGVPKVKRDGLPTTLSSVLNLQYFGPQSKLVALRLFG